MSPMCGRANPWNSNVSCRRIFGHEKDHGTHHSGLNPKGHLVEWVDKQPEMWSPPKPTPVFITEELAEIYLALSKSPDVSNNLVNKVAKLLKEAL